MLLPMNLPVEHADELWINKQTGGEKLDGVVLPVGSGSIYSCIFYDLDEY